MLALLCACCLSPVTIQARSRFYDFACKTDLRSCTHQIHYHFQRFKHKLSVMRLYHHKCPIFRRSFSFAHFASFFLTFSCNQFNFFMFFLLVNHKNWIVKETHFRNFEATNLLWQRANNLLETFFMKWPELRLNERLKNRNFQIDDNGKCCFPICNAMSSQLVNTRCNWYAHPWSNHSTTPCCSQKINFKCQKLWTCICITNNLNALNHRGVCVRIVIGFCC